ncbi:GGDEF domain-containing protein [Paraferrimonas sp. SM1919]|uniref:GGDEF domain-containing protein n=1 Tax=Paraferrimonas sp. SM1919 TaxID=2662263 RepID=UPI0013CF4630|nr:GGDEF domain-containing protein [Paraferrimonas sp. SM1919]
MTQGISEQSEYKQSLNHQLTTKLSKLCQGFSLDLDKQLKRIESQNYSTNTLINANKLIDQHLVARNNQLKISHSALNNILQQLTLLAPDSQTIGLRIEKLSNQLEKPIQSVWEYSIYLQQLLEVAMKIIPNQGASSAPQQPKVQMLAKELVASLNALDLRAELQQDAQDICNKLHQKLDIKVLIDLYKRVIKLLITTFEYEKNAAKAFLGILHSSLEGMAQALHSSIKSAEGANLLKEKLDLRVNHTLASLTLSVEEGLEPSEIKDRIMHNIEQLKKDLSAKTELEKQENRKLNLSLFQMKEKLKLITSEAQTFRSMLVTQSKINQLDSLTQIPNRSALENKVKSTYSQVVNHDISAWIIIADIDRFKSINDNFGHNAGDKCLQVVALTLQNTIPEESFIARYGGEEFVGILENVDAKQVTQICENIRIAIKNLAFKFKEQQIQLTISIGAAQFKRGEATEQTFEKADSCLYAAKRTSRDKVIVYECQ